MIQEMKDSERPSRVSRTPVANLRQVKVSVPKDRLSKVVTKSKSSRTDAVHSKNHLAWYVALNTKPLEKKVSCIPQIKWICPPKFSLNTGWHVAAGEGSQEAEAQKYREITVPEVIYPHLSAIPPSPLTSSPCAGGEYHGNSEIIPLIPIIPIEEAAALVDTSSAPVNCTMNLQPPEDPSGNLTLSQCNDQSVKDKSVVAMLRGLGEGDLEVAAAAAATVAAVMESKEQIDTQLLIKLLTDPQMIKKLINENGLRAKPQNATIPPPEIPNTSFPLPPTFTPADKSSSQACPLISRPVNQSLSRQHCSKVETSINNSEGLKLKPICTSKPVKRSSSPLIRSMPDGAPTKNLPGQPAPPHSHIFHQIQIGGVRPPPLMPSTLRSHDYDDDDDDDETITRIINKYRGPHLNPVAPINPSTSKPNIEAIKKMINEYGGGGGGGASSSDARPNMGEMNIEFGVHEHHAWGKPKPFLGQNPVLLASTPLKTDMMVVPPTVRPNAFNSNFTSTSNFHFPPFSRVNICAPPPLDLNYYKSLIKQHGEKRKNEEHNLPKSGNYLQGLDFAQNRTSASTSTSTSTSSELNPKYQKPCLYFNSTGGCRNGSNCSYHHDLSKQQRAGAMAETPVTKRMKFLS